MPLKKREEVCGKPNQYNLQTLEYDWRELPDTHIHVPQQEPRVRDYSAFVGNGAPSGAAKQRVNPITHEALPYAPGRAERGAADGAVSPTPLPSPSRPVQEDVRRRRSPSPQAHNGNRDRVAELFGGAATPARASPRRDAPAPPLTPEALPQTPAQAYPQSPGYYPYPAQATPGPYAAPPSPAAPPQAAAPAFVAPWSHEDIKRVVYTNHVEAQRCYLR